MDRTNRMCACTQHVEETYERDPLETSPPRLLDREQVAAMLGVHRRQVERMSREPGFPAPVGYFRGRMLWDSGEVADCVQGLAPAERVAHTGT